MTCRHCGKAFAREEIVDVVGDKPYCMDCISTPWPAIHELEERVGNLEATLEGFPELEDRLLDLEIKVNKFFDYAPEERPRERTANKLSSEGSWVQELINKWFGGGRWTA